MMFVLKYFKWQLLILILVAVGVLTPFIIGNLLVKPHPRIIGAPPADFRAETIEIRDNGGQSIFGWFAEGSKQSGILLLHSVRSDRREMLSRARFLWREGYSVLLIDMQAHGESPGEKITFGELESQSAKSALHYLHERLPGQSIGVIGVSMGGAAALLAEKPLDADAIVLEAVYSTIEQAVRNRVCMRVGFLEKFISPLLLWQLEPRLGINFEKLAPLKQIANLAAPVLLIAGSADQHTLLSESTALFDQIRHEKKSLWVIEGAKHQDFYRFTPQKYEQKILEFFAENL